METALPETGCRTQSPKEPGKLLGLARRYSKSYQSSPRIIRERKKQIVHKVENLNNQ